MIPESVKKYLDEHIIQEIYVQVSVIKGRNKSTTRAAIDKYIGSNHYKDLSNGEPYNSFIGEIKDKCLTKLINSPMRNKKTDDEIIKELQKKLNELSTKELNDTYWEIESGEYLSGNQIKELENKRDELISKLNISSGLIKHEDVYEIILLFCKNYETLCNDKYPEAPLPLEILKQ